MEYVRSAKAAGLDVDEIGSRLSFFFGIGMSLYMEVWSLLASRTREQPCVLFLLFDAPQVAKLRAARAMWADIMKNRMGAKKVRRAVAKACVFPVAARAALVPSLTVGVCSEVYWSSLLVFGCLVALRRRPACCCARTARRRVTRSRSRIRTTTSSERLWSRWRR